jgi:hypothetical protein
LPSRWGRYRPRAGRAAQPSASTVGSRTGAPFRKFEFPAVSPLRLRVSQYLSRATFPVPSASQTACGLARTAALPFASPNALRDLRPEATFTHVASLLTALACRIATPTPPLLAVPAFSAACVRWSDALAAAPLRSNSPTSSNAGSSGWLDPALPRCK